MYSNLLGADDNETRLESLACQRRYVVRLNPPSIIAADSSQTDEAAFELFVCAVWRSALIALSCRTHVDKDTKDSPSSGKLCVPPYGRRFAGNADTSGRSIVSNRKALPGAKAQAFRAHGQLKLPPRRRSWPGSTGPSPGNIVNNLYAFAFPTINPTSKLATSFSQVARVGDEKILAFVVLVITAWRRCSRRVSFSEFSETIEFTRLLVSDIVGSNRDGTYWEGIAYQRRAAELVCQWQRYVQHLYDQHLYDESAYSAVFTVWRALL